MAKSYLTEDQIKEFAERIKVTSELGQKHNAKLTLHGNVLQYNTLDVIVALYSERLEKSSQRLNNLTWALVVLTAILAILTGITLWKP